MKCEDCKFKANLSLDLPAQLYLPIDEIEQRVVSFLSRAVSQNQIRLLAIDYDATICQVLHFLTISHSCHRFTPMVVGQDRQAL